MELATRLLSDETGAAFVEALAAVPVLGLVLAGVLALNAMYGAKLESKARARRVAWLQSDSGKCLARSCAGGSCRAIEAEMRASGVDALDSTRDGRFSLTSFVGSVKEFFVGRTTTGVGTAHAPTPRSVSSGQTQKRGATILLCNTMARRTDSGDSILDHACSTGLSTTEYAREVCR
jgi:hypothetical protein